MIIFNIFLHLLIILIFSSSIYGYGILFNKYIYNQKSNLGEIGLYGFVLIYFIVFIFHFFLPINFFLSLSLFIFGSFYFFLNKHHFIDRLFFKKKYLIIFLLFFVSSLTVNLHDDVRLYQLPYVKLVQEFKIIFGLVNINDFYAYSHGLYDIMSIFKLPYYNNRFIFLIPVIFLFFFTITIIDYLNDTNEHKIIKFFIFLILVLFLTKFYRSKEYGTDLPVTSLIFLSQIYFLKLYKNFDNVFFGKLIIFSVFAFFLKVYSFLIFVFLIYLLKYYQNIYKFIKHSYILTIFLIIFTIISFSKTFILTGCLVYPEPKTCISKENINWSYGSDLTKTRKDFLTAGSKGWRQYLRLNNYDDLISAEDYLKTYKVKYLYFVLQDNDRERILLPIIISSLFFLILFLFYRKSIYKESIPKSILILSSLTFLFWLYLFPISKYGGYAYILFFIYLIFYNLFNSFIYSQKFVSSILIFCSIFFIIKSTDRIYDEIILSEKNKIDINFNNSDFPIPIFRKIKSYKSTNNNIDINVANDGFECSDIKPICIPANSKDLIKLKKNKLGYIFVFGDTLKLKNYQQRWTDATHFLID